MLDLEKFNYHGLNHKNVAIRFEGAPTYVGTFCLFDEYEPCAVYHSAEPNREKGHKDFLLISVRDYAFVRGLDAAEMEKWRKQDAVRCLECNDVIYSVMRHDHRYCSCEAVSIDGGRDYTKLGYTVLLQHEPGVVDLLTGVFTAA